MATCRLCGKLATDPGKGPSPWARAVIAREQVLVCPDCQRLHPTWIDRTEACPVCASHRLSRQLGDTVCRSCGHQWSEEPFTLD